MIILKYAGLAVIFCCLGGAGFYGAANEKLSLSHTDALLGLVRYIASQIEYYRTPLDEIYASFEDHRLNCGDFLALLRRGGLADALGSHSLRLSPPVLDTLKRFAATLGDSCREDTVRECLRISGILEDERKRLAEALPSRVKLYTTLGLSAALTFVVMFI